MTSRTPLNKADATWPAGARQLWKAYLEAFELDERDLTVLREALNALRNAESMEQAAAGGPLIVRGSGGGQIVNPLWAEARQQRKVSTDLLRRLPELTEEETARVVPIDPARSEHGRKAANARWGVHRVGGTA